MPGGTRHERGTEGQGQQGETAEAGGTAAERHTIHCGCLARQSVNLSHIDLSDTRCVTCAAQLPRRGVTPRLPVAAWPLLDCCAQQLSVHRVILFMRYYCSVLYFDLGLA